MDSTTPITETNISRPIMKDSTIETLQIYGMYLSAALFFIGFVICLVMLGNMPDDSPQTGMTSKKAIFYYMWICIIVTILIICHLIGIDQMIFRLK